jgi:hypothetical protein
MADGVQLGQNSEGRNQKGRFEKGNQASVGNNGGRPKQTNKAEYQQILQEEITPDKWKDVVTQAFEDAKSEDPQVRIKARDWLGKYLLPQKQEIEITGGERPVRYVAVEDFQEWNDSEDNGD